MNLVESSPCEKLEHKYGSLLTNQVKIILESGLLLDEDYEVLLKATNFKIYSNREFCLPLGLIVCGVTTVASVIVANRYNQPLVVLPSVGLTIAKLYIEVKKGLKEKRRNEVTNLALQSLVKVKRLNKAIVQYLKIRSDLNSKQKESLILNNKNVQDFVKHFIENSTELLYYVLNELNFLSCLTDDLIDDFQGIKELNVGSILQSNNHLQPENVALKVDDLYALLTSKFLNYLGLNFCKLLNDFNVREMSCLLDDTLPRLSRQLDGFREKVETDFNNLRYCVIQKQKINSEKPLTRHISGKLRQTLHGSVNNLALIMEKSQELLQKAETLDETQNVKEFETSLRDLRNHAFATYESLDVLCRLYGILSQTQKDTSTVPKISTSLFRSNINSTPSVNFDDVMEPLEENYELYLDEDEDTSSEKTHNVFEDQSSAYLGLMIKELRQSLQKHNRFLEAKNRRGIQDEDQEKEMKNEDRKLPKFDIFMINSSKVIEQGCEDNEKEIPSIPAPLPPPLPVFKLEEAGEVSKSGLLNSIRALSTQMDAQVDTFGSSGSEEDSCDSD